MSRFHGTVPDPSNVIAAAHPTIRARASMIHVLRIRIGRRTVAQVSSSAGDGHYVVVASRHAWQCTCPYGMRGQTCKHQVAVAERMMRPTLEDLRQSYAAIAAESGMPVKEFTEQVRQRLAGASNPTPQTWVRAAEQLVAELRSVDRTVTASLGGKLVTLKGPVAAVDEAIDELTDRQNVGIFVTYIAGGAEVTCLD